MADSAGLEPDRPCRLGSLAGEPIGVRRRRRALNPPFVVQVFLRRRGFLGFGAVTLGLGTASLSFAAIRESITPP